MRVYVFREEGLLLDVTFAHNERLDYLLARQSITRCRKAYENKYEAKHERVIVIYGRPCRDPAPLALSDDHDGGEVVYHRGCSCSKTVATRNEFISSSSFGLAILHVSPSSFNAGNITASKMQLSS